MPLDPNTLDLRLFTQVVALDTKANSLGLTTSDYVNLVVGR